MSVEVTAADRLPRLRRHAEAGNAMRDRIPPRGEIPGVEIRNRRLDTRRRVLQAVVTAVASFVVDVENAGLAPRLLQSFFMAVEVVANLERPAVRVPGSILAF